MAFASRLDAATLLLASDGLLNYAPPQRIAELAIIAELSGLATRLCDLVRLRSGALPDDVAILLGVDQPCTRVADTCAMDLVTSVVRSRVGP